MQGRKSELTQPAGPVASFAIRVWPLSLAVPDACTRQRCIGGRLWAAFEAGVEDDIVLLHLVGADVGLGP